MTLQGRVLSGSKVKGGKEGSNPQLFSSLFLSRDSLRGATRALENSLKKPSLKWFLRCFSLYDVLILCIFENIQASRCVGKNSRVLVCHCRRADDRAPGACHCFQLQLLLSQGDRPGRDAVTKFQPCPVLSIHAWSFR